MEELLAYIHSLMPFSQQSWDNLRPALTPYAFKKNQYLLQPREVCTSLFFISKGYCRAFYDKDGEDINSAFFLEWDIATNINSFAKGEPSAFAIQAGEDVTAVGFDKQKLREAAQHDPHIDLLGRQCLQLIAAKQEIHAAMYKLMSAQERYEYVGQNSPGLLRRISLTQLSSYLGVSRETLSRIRSRRV